MDSRVGCRAQKASLGWKRNVQMNLHDSYGLGISRLVAIHGPHWEDIGETLDFFPTKCRDRFRVIRLDYNRGPWSQEETDQLSEIVLRLKSNGHLGPFWVIVSEEMKTRNATQCLLKWQVLTLVLHL